MIITASGWGKNYKVMNGGNLGIFICAEKMGACVLIAIGPRLWLNFSNELLDICGNTALVCLFVLPLSPTSERSCHHCPLWAFLTPQSCSYASVGKSISCRWVSSRRCSSRHRGMGSY